MTTRTLLYVEGVTVSFEGFLALRTLNFVVDTGERVRVIIGPNGAGKTTLFDVLTGHVRPESGRVIFGANTDLLELGTPAIATLGITRKFQTPSVFPSHTVLQNMVLAAGGKGLRATLRSAAGMDPAVALVRDQVGCCPTRSARRARSRTARSSGWRSRCSWPSARRCCCWTSRSRG